MKKAIATEKAPAAIGPYSQGVEFCQLIFTSGQLPLD
ncbi:MAG: regulator, partial [Firmicutes bacterium]|nr:regulator [Bacillota bacterium]